MRAVEQRLSIERPVAIAGLGRERSRDGDSCRRSSILVTQSDAVQSWLKQLRITPLALMMKSDGQRPEESDQPRFTTCALADIAPPFVSRSRAAIALDSIDEPEHRLQTQ
jgi:hypothetical protein